MHDKTNAEIEADAVTWLRGVAAGAERFAQALATGTEDDPPRQSAALLDGVGVLANLTATVMDKGEITNRGARRIALLQLANAAVTRDMLLHQGWTPESIPPDPRGERQAVALFLEQRASDLGALLEPMDGETTITDPDCWQALSSVLAMLGAAEDAVRNGWGLELSLHAHAFTQRLQAARALRGGE